MQSVIVFDAYEGVAGGGFIKPIILAVHRYNGFCLFCFSLPSLIFSLIIRLRPCFTKLEWREDLVVEWRLFMIFFTLFAYNIIRK